MKKKESEGARGDEEPLKESPRLLEGGGKEKESEKTGRRTIGSQFR